jgi:hypothetical protein
VSILLTNIRILIIIIDIEVSKKCVDNVGREVNRRRGGLTCHPSNSSNTKYVKVIKE